MVFQVFRHCHIGPLCRVQTDPPLSTKIFHPELSDSVTNRRKSLSCYSQLKMVNTTRRFKLTLQCLFLVKSNGGRSNPASAISHLSYITHIDFASQSSLICQIIAQNISFQPNLDALMVENVEVDGVNNAASQRSVSSSLQSSSDGIQMNLLCQSRKD